MHALSCDSFSLQDQSAVEALLEKRKVMRKGKEVTKPAVARSHSSFHSNQVPCYCRWSPPTRRGSHWPTSPTRCTLTTRTRRRTRRGCSAWRRGVSLWWSCSSRTAGCQRPAGLSLSLCLSLSLSVSLCLSVSLSLTHTHGYISFGSIRPATTTSRSFYYEDKARGLQVGHTYGSAFALTLP